ncbi:hypothetical protein [Motilimonas cestriensis]|uniref:hypothetical protein n=1 Tax=Motilimonas cestriensis TaxID=2742685 RepID=UPI003DA3DC4E
MRILITGARAPVALEWARILLAQGHQVFLSDCCRFPVGKFVSGISGYIQTSSPRSEPKQYQCQITALVKQHQITLLIPTCEEVFYLAQFSHRLNGVNTLICDAPLLFGLHDKFQLFTLLAGLPGVRLPRTKKITRVQQIDLKWDSILKPTFCRFGEQVIRNINQASLQEITVSPQQSWVQQQKLTGQAFCNYALCDRGVIIAHQVYLPEYRVNQSAATYFRPTVNRAINEFMSAFVSTYHFHGQVSFDFIEHLGSIYVIECNPRTTSGLHLIADNLHWPSMNTPMENSQNKAKYVGLAMLLAGGGKALLNAKIWCDFYQGDNVLASKRYPLRPWALLLSTGELLLKSLRQRKSVTAASTDDIEWNGE